MALAFGVWRLAFWRLAFRVWRFAFRDWRLAFGVWRVALGVWRFAFGVWRLAFGVWRLAFGVSRFAFGVWRLAFGVWRLAFRESETDTLGKVTTNRDSGSIGKYRNSIPARNAKRQTRNVTANVPAFGASCPGSARCVDWMGF
jgi:hypothetical protein